MIFIKEIGKHLKSVLEEDVDKPDSLSFARRLYKALTSKTCDALYGGKNTRKSAFDLLSNSM